MAEAGSFDWQAMLPQLVAMAGSGQLPGGAEGGYQARGGQFDTRIGSFSLGGTLDGGLATMALMSFLPPELRDRLQSSAGINSGNRTQSSLARQAMMDINMRGGGEEMARNLGLGPAAAPFMSIAATMIPGVRQAMYLTTPTAMYTSGQTAVDTFQLMNPMSDVRAGQSAAFLESTLRLGTHGGLLNTRFTHGMNLDELSEAKKFAADMGDLANDLDIPEVRRQARKRLVAQGYQGDLEEGVTTAVEQERLTVAGSYNLQASRAMRAFMPGASNAEALGMMREMGMSAQTKGEATNLEGVIRSLEALGKQAGMTTQDMVNAGRVLTAQNGGSLTYNMAVAGQAQAAERLLTREARDAGLDTNAYVGSIITSDIATQNSNFQTGGYNKAITAAWMSSEAYRTRIGKAVMSGNDTDFQAVANEVIYGKTEAGKAAAGFYNVSPEMRAAQQNEMFQRFGTKLTDMNASLVLKDQLGRLGAYEAPFGRYLRDEKFTSALAQEYQRVGRVDQTEARFGITGANKTLFDNWIGRTGSVGNTILKGLVNNYGRTRLGKDRAERVAEQQSIADIDEILQNEGAGQGLFQGFKQGTIKSPMDAMVAAGYATPEARAQLEKVLSKHSPRQREAFMKKLQGLQSARVGAISVLQDETAAESARTDAEMALADADEGLLGMGIKSAGSAAERDKEKNWVNLGLKAKADRQRSVGDAASKSSVSTGNTGAGNPPTKVEFGKLEVEVRYPDGSKDATTHAMEANVVQGRGSK